MRRSTPEHRLGGRLLTTDAWAGYVIYKYWPKQHVFFDDRYDMYPIALTDAYNKVPRLKPGWDKVLDQYRINVVVWPKDGARRAGARAPAGLDRRPHRQGRRDLRPHPLALRSSTGRLRIGAAAPSPLRPGPRGIVRQRGSHPETRKRPPVSRRPFRSQRST